VPGARRRAPGTRHPAPGTAEGTASAASRHNLPHLLTRFIGREKELVEVCGLMAAERLVTLTGMGGCGKTRLALEVARDQMTRYPDGVWLIELASLADPSLLPQSVASVLGVREAPGRPPTDVLINFLRSRSLLLLLDNCEHLLGASAQFAEALLQSCPQLSILATSREELGIAGEVAYRVPPLSLPGEPRIPIRARRTGAGSWVPGAGSWVPGAGSWVPPGAGPPTPESLLESEAARLFADRAATARPGFTLSEQNVAAVAHVCRLLDGIPLAIEMAAAHLKALPVEQVAQRLDDRFRLLKGGDRTAPPRHQTLRALIDWSYHLLSPEERAMLCCLSVFRGGWTLEAAEAVYAEDDALDLLGALVRKSFVLFEEHGGAARYRMLETVRQYAGERLRERGEEAAVRGRHLAFFVAFAEQAGSVLPGPGSPEWQQRCEQELDNLRAALDWSRSAEDGTAAGLRLAGAIWPFWLEHGYLREGRRRLEEVLRRSEGIASVLRARALEGALAFGNAQGDFTAARVFGQESLALYRQWDDRESMARVLQDLGWAALRQDESDAGRRSSEESLAIWRELGNQAQVRGLLRRLADLARRAGDEERARALHQERLALARAEVEQESIHGDPERAAAMRLLYEIDRAQEEGDAAAARALYTAGQELCMKSGRTAAVALAMTRLGHLAFDEEDYEMARFFFGEALAISREVGETGDGWLLFLMARAARCQGDLTAAREFGEESLECSRAMGNREGVGQALSELCLTALRQGDLTAAYRFLTQHLAENQQVGSRWGIAIGLEGAAYLAVEQGQPDRAARLLGAAEGIRERFQRPLEQFQRGDYEQAVTAARAALGQETFAAAWAAGRALSLEQAIATALTRDG
jgi:non-specific serine/threonine protein kinase